MLKTSQPAHTTPASGPSWKYASSVYLPKHHCVIYRDDALGVQKQVMTRRTTLFFPPREREFFFIDGDHRTFRSEDSLLKALTSSGRRKP